ncbi:flagellar biogenesis protein FliO [Pseudomonas sp. JUb42]|uniref:hypothetical protein n=1 Tax=Pseudomonas sp. JUb42 TaxID=2940611 RepID=UPI002168ED11|nr:hypothetical protein [Pseudomonas sp. JUb42]MCS3472541.1 flagellar biogenesis protein FliO [Pseudomonas sp. JUb42]
MTHKADNRNRFTTRDLLSIIFAVAVLVMACYAFFRFGDATLNFFTSPVSGWANFKQCVVG